MFDTNDLSPTHLVLIDDARRHVDRRLLPPERVRGRARRLLAEKLIGLGVAEFVAGAEGAWWIDPDSGATGLRLVAVDVEADNVVVVSPGIGAEDAIVGPEPDRLAMRSPVLPDASAAADLSTAPSHLVEGKLSKQPIEPRSWTKIARVLGLLRQPHGADLQALIEATGWLPHTTRAALTGLRRKGHTIIALKLDGQTLYRIDHDSNEASGVEQDGASVPPVGCIWARR